MTQIIRAVIFDLGDTLMYSPDPWPPIFERAGIKLSDTLCASGIKINCETFYEDFLKRLDEYYLDRERNLMETSTLVILRQLLDENGHPELNEEILRLALDGFYAVTQQNWQLESDAIPVLENLLNHGFRLGLISNAGDDRDVSQLVDKFNIEHYFDFVLTSAACGYRKPHPHIFELALNSWKLMPDEIAMVGDRLDADIGGAGPLGFFTIWIKRRAKVISEHRRFNTNPDAIVETLEEIESILLKSE